MARWLFLDNARKANGKQAYLVDFLSPCRSPPCSCPSLQGQWRLDILSSLLHAAGSQASGCVQLPRRGLEDGLQQKGLKDKKLSLRLLPSLPSLALERELLGLAMMLQPELKTHC